MTAADNDNSPLTESDNEELEISRYELQALNMELATVNAELNEKVKELNQACADVVNLLASSELSMIFLNTELIIKRFSPAMATIFNLNQADIGRPFRHLADTIDWNGLQQDAENVLGKMVPVEREVTAIRGGRCFLMRLLPYRTIEGVVDGIVITLIDISEHKRAEEALRLAKEEWERTFDSVPDLIAIMDREHRINRVNRAMAERLGLKAEECVGRACFHCVHSTELPPKFCPHLLTLADGGEHVAEIHEESLGGDFLVTTTPLLDAQGGIAGTVHIARDITERKRAEDIIKRQVAELSETNRELEQFNRASVGREIRMIELKKEVNELCRRVGEPPRYQLDFEGGEQ